VTVRILEDDDEYENDFSTSEFRLKPVQANRSGDG